jgi:hypothetical protein
MKLRVAAAAALASVVVSSAASADVRVTNDTGGEITTYLNRYEGMRATGERLVIDGPCLSACTLFTAFIPRDRVCVTRRAVLGFHSASYYNSTSRSFVPTSKGTALVMRIYPPEIRGWIMRHGGLSPNILTMRGRELAALYPACQ